MLIYHLSGSHMREPLFSVSGALFGTSLRKTLITIIMKETSISLFKGYSDTHPQDSTLQEIVNLIRNDALVRDRTEKHRYYSHNGQKAAAAWEKAACPCFAVAVCFGGGKQAENIMGWTSLALADIDHIDADRLPELIGRVRADKHTLLSYTTISGTGLRIIYRTDCLTATPEKNRKVYSKIFEQGNRYYADLLGCECDLKCKNITRLSGLAHDPDVYFNPDAAAMPVELKGDKKEQPAKPSIRNRRLEKAVAAAAGELAEQGIVYEAHQRNQYIMRMGYLLNAYGVAQASATQWAVKRFADYDGDVAAVFRSCYQRTEEHGRRPLQGRTPNAGGNDGFASVEDIERFLDTQARFRYNEATGKCETAVAGTDGAEGEYTEIDDRFVNTLWSRMSKQGKTVRINDIRAILHSEYTVLFNPFTEYFEGLKPWDGVTDHIGRLAATVHVKSEQSVFEGYFKKWLVASIASLFDRETVNHEIFVLIGPQGSYKTTWLNKLLPPVLQRYFYIKSNNNRITKDDMFSLAEFVFICMEEIDELGASELNQIKAMTTQKVVNERMAYAHYKEHRAHIASLCGTTNNVQFLTDLTGNRRWLPFEISSIDNPYTHPVDYEGVYSQAYALWKGGMRYWFEDEEIKLVNLHNRNFEVPSMERELIQAYYRCPLPGEEGTFVSTTDILSRINSAVKHYLSPVKIGLVMKQAGFELTRSNGKRGYRVVELPRN